MKVLMVCLGNICRSPLAHGILQDMIEKQGLNWHIDSAGTNGFHDGELPDPRSQKVALENDIDITYQRSRQITKNDLQEFDHIYVIDSSNFQNVTALCSDDMEKSKVKMLMNEAYPGKNINVPDPYYGGEDGFTSVFDQITLACEEIIRKYA